MDQTDQPKPVPPVVDPIDPGDPLPPSEPIRPRVPISKSLVLFNGLGNITTHLLTIGVFAWAIRVLVGAVPKEELALLPVVLSVSLLAPIFQSVLTAGLGRYVTEAYARNDLRRVTTIVSSSFPLLLAGALLLGLVGLLVALNVDRLLDIPAGYKGQAQFMIALVTGRIALSVLVAAHSTGIVAKQEFLRRNAIQIGGSLLQVLLLIALLKGVAAEVQYVIVAQVAAQTWALLATCWLSRRLIPELRFRRELVQLAVGWEIVQYGGWYSVQQLAASIRRAADAPILNRLARPVDVTTFFMGGFIEDNIRNLINVASQPLLPALTAMHAAGSKDRLAAAYLRGGRLQTWIALCVAVPLFVYSEDLFRMYLGEEFDLYSETPLVLRILLLGFVVTYPSRLIFTISAATGQVKEVAVKAVIAAGVNLIATIFFVGVLGLGAVGSAVSTTAAFCLLYPLLIWPIAIRRLGVSWRRFFTHTLLPGLAPAFVAGAAGLTCNALYDHPGPLRAVVGGLTCMVIYGVAMSLVFHKADRKDLGRLVKRLRQMARWGRSPVKSPK